jgi:hypothetical protein
VRDAPRLPAARRYLAPRPVIRALESLFAEPVEAIIMIEYSRYARIHLGMRATTRPNRILLAMSGAQFVADPPLLLHEYFHVVRQWRPGHLTHWRYVMESARRGYRHNRFEREAREFTAAAAERYRECLLRQGGA